MYICFNCGFKYMLPVYEGEGHIFLRCPNKECSKMDARRKQLQIRGSVTKMNGSTVEVNTYDGEINI